MAEPVYLIGAARTDFKRNLRKEGRGLRHVIVEAGHEAIADAGISPGDVTSGVVGNFAAGLFTRQLHLGAFLTDVDESLRGIPTLHTEAACASGGVAVLTAAQQVMAGLHDVVLVVGAEQQKTMAPGEGAEVLGAAADYEAEKPRYGQYMFPSLFGEVARRYATRYGLTERQLAQVAAKNYAHARMNACAQMRESRLTLADALGESELQHGEAQGKPDRQCQHAESDAGCEEHPNDGLRSRAERDADADFPRALPHRQGDDAVQAE